MGTTALWQSTDQTSGHNATGTGTRRRVRQFRVSSDTFAELRTGEAVIHTTLGPPPAITRVKQLKLAAAQPERIGTNGRSGCEMTVHAAKQLPAPAISEVADPKSTPPTRDAGGGAAKAPVRARRERTAAKAKTAAAQTVRDAGAPPCALPVRVLEADNL
jgi:hypothetical protein